MSSFYLILALLFSLLIAVVAVANNDTVTVNYIFGRTQVSLILLILGSAISGALVIGLLSLFRAIRTALTVREIRHQKELLAEQVKRLEEDKLFLQAELNRLASKRENALSGGENRSDGGAALTGEPEAADLDEPLQKEPEDDFS